MMLVAFGCPPLPILVRKGENEHRANSHDMLAFLVDVEMRRGNQKDNWMRKAKQFALQEDFLTQDVSNLEQHLQRFTYDWMMTYSPYARDLQFLPLDCTTPVILQQVREWLSAQHILLGEEAKPEMFESLNVHDLYRRCFDAKKQMWKIEQQKKQGPSGSCCGEIVVDIPDNASPPRMEDYISEA